MASKQATCPAPGIGIQEVSASPMVWAAASLVILMWGSAFVAVRIALVDLAPGPLALGRYGIASFAFLCMLKFRRVRVPSPPDLLRLAIAGAIGIAVYNLALNQGQVSVNAGTASLLINTVPVWTSVLSVWLLKERIHPTGWLGVLLSFSGVALISLSKGSWGQFDMGTTLILLAAVAQSAYFILIKPLLKRYDAIEVTAYSVWFGFLCLLPFAPELLDSLPTLGRDSQAAVLFLGIGPAAIAYAAWAYVLSELPAGRATNLLFLVSVAAIGLGWIVLGEMPSSLALLGGLIAIAGVAVKK